MSNKIDDGGPAFARAGSEDRSGGDMPDGNSYHKPTNGMSLRDYFAAMAIAKFAELSDPHDAARYAYKLADAMLAARKASTSKP